MESWAMNAYYIILAVSVVFGVARFIVPVEGKIIKGDIYKDMAHLWVGGLIGAAIASQDKAIAGLAIALTMLEVVAFLIRRK